MSKEKTALELEMDQLRTDYEDACALLIAFQEAIAAKEECRLAVPLAVARLRKARAELKTAEQKVADLTVRVRHLKPKNRS